MKPLSGKTVLITRDASQAGSLKEMLEFFGARVISVPTISISDPLDWGPFDRVLGALDSFDWVVFTSINAVSQTKKRLLTLGHSPELISTLKVAAVGEQTAQQAEATGWDVDFVPDKFQAESLAAGLIERGVSGKKIWFPRAKVARHVLIDELEKTGAQVCVTPVYQNSIPLENRELLQNTLDRESIDWITFTSSSTVSNFFTILDRDPTQVSLPKLASIGSITTETLLQASFEPEFTADPQNLAGLCQGIVAYESETE